MARTRERIADACASVGRRPEEVTLLGVTKTVSADRVQKLIDAGVRDVGENRVGEYLEKRQYLRLDGVKTHLIGHLQTNKVGKIVGRADMIQSIDSLKVAETTEKEAARREIVQSVLLEVNIGRDPAKYGFDPDGVEEALRRIAALPHLAVKGLMTVLPILESESDRRKLFSNMYKLFIDMKGKKIDNGTMEILSMGMSGDYAEAVSEGSTMVRIGSALFGARVY